MIMVKIMMMTIMVNMMMMMMMMMMMRMTITMILSGNNGNLTFHHAFANQSPIHKDRGRPQNSTSFLLE